MHDYGKEGAYRWNLISFINQYELIQYKYRDEQQLKMIDSILSLDSKDTIWKEAFDLWYRNIYPKLKYFNIKNELNHLHTNILNFPHPLDSLIDIANSTFTTNLSFVK